LESQGWRIHRIWSTDWFQQTENEKEKIRRRIESLCLETDDSEDDFSGQREGKTSAFSEEGHSGYTSSTREVISSAVPSAVVSASLVTRADTDCNCEMQLGALAVPYAQITGNFSLSDNPVESVKGVIVRVLEREAPIHRDELQNRCRALFGYSRISGAFELHVKTAIRALERAGAIVRRTDFICLPNTQTVPRNRANVTTNTLRKPTMISPDEYDAAICCLLHHYHGASEDEMAVGVARLLGFKSTSPQLRAIIRKGFLRLSRSGIVKTDADGVIRLTA
ncbi:MAG: hypothetical protein WCK89_18560, partial [bacterium]